MVRQSRARQSIKVEGPTLTFGKKRMDAFDNSGPHASTLALREVWSYLVGCRMWLFFLSCREAQRKSLGLVLGRREVPVRFPQKVRSAGNNFYGEGWGRRERESPGEEGANRAGQPKLEPGWMMCGSGPWIPTLVPNPRNKSKERNMDGSNIHPVLRY